MQKLIATAIFAAFAMAGPVLADVVTQTLMSTTTATQTVATTTDGTSSASDTATKPKSE